MALLRFKHKLVWCLSLCTRFHPHSLAKAEERACKGLTKNRDQTADCLLHGKQYADIKGRSLVCILCHASEKQRSEQWMEWTDFKVRGLKGALWLKLFKPRARMLLCAPCALKPLAASPCGTGRARSGMEISFPNAPTRTYTHSQKTFQYESLLCL